MPCASRHRHGRSAHTVLHQRASKAQQRPGALLVGRTKDARAAAERALAAAWHYHLGEPLRSDWATLARRPLPWRHQIERTLIDPLMGAPLKWQTAKAAALRTRCNGTWSDANKDSAAEDGSFNLPERQSRPLHFLKSTTGAASSDTKAHEWPFDCQSNASRELCDVLRRVAVDRAVMMAVANQNIAHEACKRRTTTFNPTRRLHLRSQLAHRATWLARGRSRPVHRPCGAHGKGAKLSRRRPGREDWRLLAAAQRQLLCPPLQDTHGRRLVDHGQSRDVGAQVCHPHRAPLRRCLCASD
eukprot:882548-Prymnesium_polylepis.1